MKDLYDYQFIENLFDRMSKSYERVNYITSFGFSKRWRKQCVQRAGITEGAVVGDLMTGMGECWKAILAATGEKGKLIALDFSKGMLQHAWVKKTKRPEANITILKENVFDNSIPDESLDFIISGFGIKTFSPDQVDAFAAEIKRMLKPNGCFSFIEVSVPDNFFLRTLYMFYVKRIIPFIGWSLLGNPEPYKMLGIYTERFGNAKREEEIFRKQGFEVSFESYYYGCATGVRGRKVV